MEPSEEFLFRHKGFYFHPGHDITTPEYIDSLEDFEIRDSDVFVVTYPKSGTVWTQNILSLIYHEGHRDGTENIKIIDRVPWLEYNIHNMDYVHCPSLRLFATHLPYYLVPRDLKNRRAKVIYVARNPKDVAVSYFHFSSISVLLETIPDFNVFLERFLAGKVLAGSWLDHIRGWSTHKDDFNILFLTYEEMKKNLRGAVLKICKFLGKQLNEKELDMVVEKATFDQIKTDPRANYDLWQIANSMLANLLEPSKGHFLHKGTVGDWKNTMTVAQNERFDHVFKEKMKDLSSTFNWATNDDI
ncbi:amine sulfotransferase-like [Chelonoidis abingdonii]|uniref:amine sulfotransferase-like n=1 Tax=Chelonoidis abingdonii TaxID=106734 RepID=UPI0013F1AC69|nr:amine sulfotransferase-like [Chelonoidis abingdonii]